MAQRKGGLGKGLEALFAENTSPESVTSVKLRITELEPNRSQPRRVFDQSALEELADSIREVGIIQPITVRSLADGGYQIVAGERRWRAAQIAGLQEVPVIIHELTDREVAEYALIENLQREDLDAMEEAEGYRHLMDEYGMTQEQVSERMGKSRSAVANTVRLLDLPGDVQKLVRKGELTAGHARALLSLSGEADIIRLGLLAARRGMTVREIEKAVKKEKESASSSNKKAKTAERNNYLDEVELALSETLRRRVKVSGTQEHGTLEVDFFSLEELSDMANRLAGLK